MMRNHMHITTLRALLDDDSHWHVLRRRKYLTRWGKLNERNQDLLKANETDIKALLREMP